LEQEINDPIDEIASGPGRASDLVVSQKKNCREKQQKVVASKSHKPVNKECAQTLCVGKRSVYQATTILSIYKNSEVDPMLASSMKGHL
jgi:hypothetical protein